MLKLTIDAKEYFDDRTSTFLTIPKQTLILEHSLLSISKWEAKWKKPFLVTEPKKTREESLDYIRCMTVNYNAVDKQCYMGLTDSDFDKVNAYISDPMTATTFSNRAGAQQTPRNRSIVTSEVIYYDMIAYGIPFECEKWHLNRLLVLINVCRIKNERPTKMKRSDVASRNRALNAQRKAKLHTHG